MSGMNEDELSASVAGQSADSSSEVQTTTYPINFTGDGTEYFRIWILNLTLTILTLGIYSAWAKVRTNRYFYGCTELDGDSFEYHAQPIQILKGRLIAIGALVVYVLAQTFAPALSLVLFVVLVCFVPLIVVRSLRFRAVMSSWRGVRFGFQAGAWDAAKAYVFWPLFGMVTLGFGMPVAWYKQNQFAVGHHKFGTTDATSTTEVGDFYTIFWVLFGLSLGLVFAISILTAALALLGGDVETVGPALIGFWLSYFLLYVVIYAVYQAMNYRLVYQNIVLGGTRSDSNVVTGQWVGIVVVNSILLVLTLGLFYPWAKVRLTRYMLAHTAIHSNDLAGFVARTGEDESAMGEEFGEAFDLGIGV